MFNRFYLKDFIASYVTERQESLFEKDIRLNHQAISQAISGSSVLVIGGAGTIGSSFIKALLPFEPASLTVVDTDENGLAELVRDLRSDGDNRIPKTFVTYPMDFAGKVFGKILGANYFDIIGNFAAHKHVRSDKDRFSVEAMLTNNVLSAHQLLTQVEKNPPSHFFCVSTDKAANPVNIMGASKKLMEEVIFNRVNTIPVKTARFANVAFSNGSLPDGFLKRMAKRQPIAAPQDVKRFFISPEESGEICLLSCVLGKAGEIFFPKLASEHMKTFSSIAIDLLKEWGYEPVVCSSEDDARQMARYLAEGSNQYPVYFFNSDTNGEKHYEEFFTENEKVDMGRFMNLGVITRIGRDRDPKIDKVINDIEALFARSSYSKNDILDLLEQAVPSFKHLETGKYLDEKM
jgi:FlaA1/EpsC-like NDP-sugar epimerase